MVLTWPQAATNDFYLQFTTNLSPLVDWRNASDPTTNGTDLVVADDATASSRFYRLQAWEVLFDGTSTSALRGYQQTNFPAINRWLVTTNGELRAVAYPTPHNIGTNDIVTRAQFSDFELVWEWKASVGGNSGVMYRCTEQNSAATLSGPEYQLLDDTNSNYTGLPANQKMGAIYALFSPTTNKVLVPTGEWNQCRLLVQSNHVEHWLNGRRLISYEINSPAWTNALAAYTNYGNIPGFGQARSGYIAFQGHGEDSWFRNIKVRRLPPQ
jgi:hypothetical protein